MKKRRSMWDMMKTTSEEFLAQEKRIDNKRELLEAHGVDVNISHIKKPDIQSIDKEQKKKPSMWETYIRMEKQFEEQKEYLDKLEAVYDNAIKEILGPNYEF